MKYAVNDIPAANASAFMPVMNAAVSAKAAMWGMVRISGNPGAYPVSSPKPASIPPGPLPRSAQPSYNAPDAIYPSQYYTTITNFGPASDGIRYVSTNEVPLPAVRVQRLAGVAARRPRYGGLRQITWPPAPQSWQNVNAGGTSG